MGVIRSGEAPLRIHEHTGRRRLHRFQAAEAGLHGSVHFRLQVTDADGWPATIEHEGFEVLHGGVIDWPHPRVRYVMDPTGHEIDVALWDGDRLAFA